MGREESRELHGNSVEITRVLAKNKTWEFHDYPLAMLGYWEWQNFVIFMKSHRRRLGLGKENLEDFHEVKQKSRGPG